MTEHRAAEAGAQRQPRVCGDAEGAPRPVGAAPAVPRGTLIAEAVGGWPSIVAVAAAGAVAIAVYGDFDGPLRPPIVLGFLLMGPGTPLVRLLRLSDPLSEAVIAVGLSLALAMLVSVGLLFAGEPSSDVALAVLIGITLVGTGANVALRPSVTQGARDPQ